MEKITTGISNSNGNVTEKQLARLHNLFEKIEIFLKNGQREDYTNTVKRLSRITRSGVSFPTFIKLGPKFEKGIDLFFALQKEHYEILGDAKEVLFKPDFDFHRDKKEVEITNLSLEELGFKDDEGSPKFSEICKRAKNFYDDRYLELCPKWLGPKFLLQYIGLPEETHYYIAMKPIISAGTPSIFSIQRIGDKRWIGLEYVQETKDRHHWFDFNRFIFAVRRKKK